MADDLLDEVRKAVEELDAANSQYEKSLIGGDDERIQESIERLDPAVQHFSNRSPEWCRALLARCEAAEAQLKSTGHVPYLQRMNELAARAEAAEAERDDYRTALDGMRQSAVAWKASCHMAEAERDKLLKLLKRFEWSAEDTMLRVDADTVKVLVDAENKAAKGECLHWHIRRTATNDYYCSDCGREALVDVSPLSREPIAGSEE